MTLAYDMHMVAKEAAEEAAKEAFEDGFSAGEERGISIGLSQGITQGEKKAKLETAKKFLSMGLSVKQVADGTGLSPEEIEKM